jgi:hypothetical protein
MTDHPANSIIPSWSGGRADGIVPIPSATISSCAWIDHVSAVERKLHFSLA